MKKTQVQRMRVTRTDGTVVDACCGPAVVAMGAAVAGYQPVGQATPGVCCHTGAQRKDGVRQHPMFQGRPTIPVKPNAMAVEL